MSDLREMVGHIGEHLQISARMLFGTTTRSILTVGIGCLIVGFVLGYTNSGGDDQNEQLEVALNVARYFETTSRELKIELETEQRRRKLVEQTVSALANSTKKQNVELLEVQQQLEFYEQLLKERGQQSEEVVIRNFTIDPDIGDTMYRSDIVLTRRGNVKAPFIGRIELKIFVNSGASGREYVPAIAAEQLQVEFHYYLEKSLIFAIPRGSDILNAQLFLYNDSDTVINVIPLYLPE